MREWGYSEFRAHMVTAQISFFTSTRMNGCQTGSLFWGALYIRGRSTPKRTVKLQPFIQNPSERSTWLPNSSRIGGFSIIRCTFGGVSHNEDCSILGSIVGSPCCGRLPYP